MRRLGRAIGIVAIIGAVIVGRVVVRCPLRRGILLRRGAAQQDTAPTDVPARPADAFAVTVSSVWDGDTLRARVTTPHDLIRTTDDVRVRLIGIDTPEVSDPAECWGAEATAHLEALAPAGAVLWASFDVDPLDRYERYLLYLWTEDGRFINGELVAAGDAETLTVAPNDEYAALFAAAEQTARASARRSMGRVLTPRALPVTSRNGPQTKRNSTNPMSGSVPCTSAARRYFEPVEISTSAAATIDPSVNSTSVRPATSATVPGPPAQNSASPMIAPTARNRL